MVNNAADEAAAAEVVRAVRKRLQHRERRVLLLSLELLESLMKNCHEPLHSQVGTADFLGELSRLALASRTAGEVAQRALALIDSWGVAFQGHPRLTEFCTELTGKSVRRISIYIGNHHTGTFMKEFTYNTFAEA